MTSTTDKSISSDVRHFILRYIDSVEMLEVLLFLFKSETKAWTVEQISASLRSANDSVTNRLNQLSRDGFVKIEANGAYRFAGPSHSLAPVISKLDQVYTTHRIRLIELIYSRPNDRILTFADAFRFKKGNDDG